MDAPITYRASSCASMAEQVRSAQHGRGEMERETEHDKPRQAAKRDGIADLV